jgi:hypothetical protein
MLYPQQHAAQPTCVLHCVRQAQLASRELDYQHLSSELHNHVGGSSKELETLRQQVRQQYEFLLQPNSSSLQESFQISCTLLVQQYALLGRAWPITACVSINRVAMLSMPLFRASNVLALIACCCCVPSLLQKRTSDQALTTANEDLARVKQE